MRTWFKLLAPLLVWLCHFLGLYLAAEFYPPALSWLVPVLTAAALVFLAALAAKARHDTSWYKTIAGGGSLIAALAVIWQALPSYL